MIRSTAYLLIIISCLGCSTTKKVIPTTTIVPRNVCIMSGNEQMQMGPCEPTIAISEKDPNIILAGSILNHLHKSIDGGQTWTTSILTSPYGVFGDPVIHSDQAGNFYYAHLSDPDNRGWASPKLLDRIVIDKSTDNGKTFVSSFTGLAHPKDQDKQWLGSDPKTGQLFCTWTEFDKYNSTKKEDKSRILYSGSTDAGATWSTPVQLSQKEGDCLDTDQTTEGAVPCAGINGEIYVGWAFDEAIYFDRSLDRGKTWLTEDVKVTGQPGGWDIEIPGIGRCNGMPVTESDISNGKYRGNIYINWSDRRNGKSDTDIWIAKSSDQGKTWSKPIRVNQDDSKKQQFFSWMTVDQSSGFVYIVYYDRSLHVGNETDVVLATSKDGGSTWVNKKISEKPFTPLESLFFGDYNDISAVKGHIMPIWTAVDSHGNLQIWTALIEEMKPEK
jgi:hypothetical protein